jgi:hypothetical protein
MRDADAFLKSGRDQALIELGFSTQHISELRLRAGPDGGYPPYSLRNIEETIRLLQLRRRAVSVVLAVSKVVDRQ